jgi:hypothetical protein
LPIHKRYEECKAGNNQNTGSTTDFKRSPREPGQFSFEILQYMLDEDLMNRLMQHNIKQVENKHDENSNVGIALHDDMLVLHLASDFKTGLMREIKSLVGLGMVTINENGITSLKDDWQSKMHPFMLNEMWETGWNKEVDDANKFCINTKIRDAIDMEWRRSSEGWISQSAQAVRYYHHEYEHSRNIFASNFEGLMNEMDGIAQFGI